MLRILLACDRFAYSKTSTTLCTATSEHFTTIGGRHAFTETMLVNSFSVRGLKCSFHRSIIVMLLSFVKSTAKLHKTFDTCNRIFNVFQKKYALWLLVNSLNPGEAFPGVLHGAVRTARHPPAAEHKLQHEEQYSHKETCRDTKMRMKPESPVIIQHRAYNAL